VAQPAPPAAPARGPVGKLRSPVTVILLSLVTIGIYGVVYDYKSFKEMKEYSGNGIGGGIAIVLALLLGFVIPFLMSSEVAALYRAEGLESPVRAATGFWILLPLIGGIIWIVKTQGALNRFWEAHGARRV
jgi:uncharacterized membrane protein YraQ (UPF0718 family)